MPTHWQAVQPRAATRPRPSERERSPRRREPVPDAQRRWLPHPRSLQGPRNSMPGGAVAKPTKQPRTPPLPVCAGSCAQCLATPTAASLGALASCTAVGGVDPDVPADLQLVTGPQGTLVLDQDVIGEFGMHWAAPPLRPSPQWGGRGQGRGMLFATVRVTVTNRGAAAAQRPSGCVPVHT